MENIPYVQLAESAVLFTLCQAVEQTGQVSGFVVVVLNASEACYIVIVPLGTHKLCKVTCPSLILFTPWLDSQGLQKATTLKFEFISDPNSSPAAAAAQTAPAVPAGGSGVAPALVALPVASMPAPAAASLGASIAASSSISSSSASQHIVMTGLDQLAESDSEILKQLVQRMRVPHHQRWVAVARKKILT